QNHLIQQATCISRLIGWKNMRSTMKWSIGLLSLIIGGMGTAFCQNAILSGTVTDRNTQAPLVGVSIVIDGSDPIIGTVSDAEGNFKLTSDPGSYTIKVTYIGYQELKKFNVVLTTGNATVMNFELVEGSTTLDEVVVQASPSAAVATIETPLSIQSLSTEEIKSNPGGNFDISKVIQSLPGVSTSAGGVRNDIIIRGGAPNENVYYLDGIEVPVINHFSTQGSAGGPQGILNVSFIEEVNLSTSGFHARYDNPLSSVFQFKQRDGNMERIQGNVRLSGTELAATFDGPLSPNTTFLASARRSYLQYFFQLIDLPIRPNYWDFQFKVTHHLNDKTSLTALGLGAIDEFSFAVPKESTPEKEYVLRSNPFINQDSYTLGLSLKRLMENGFMNISMSRNYFNNRLDKFEDGRNDDESLRTLGVDSDEIENKLRVDINKSVNGWKYSYGIMGQYVQFRNDVFNTVRKEIMDGNGNVVQPSVIVDVNSELDFFKYGAFLQISRSVLDNRLSVSGGVRSDMNSFMHKGNDPLQTLSPRLSASYALSDHFNISGSAGRYYKIPVYTILGFQDNQGDFINRDVSYIGSTHYVGGVEFLPNDAFRATVEGFYKQYSDYPVSKLRGVSLANEGGDFGFIGNEEVVGSGKGRAYGVELFVQKKLTGKIFYVIAYTLYRTEFSGADNRYLPSSWDNRNLLSGLLGRKLKRGWEIGLKFRYAGGAPYTPLDLEASRVNYLSLGTGVPDVTRINSQRLESFNQFDFRIDKKWNYRQWTFDLYLDVQNAFMSKTPATPDYTFARNEDGSYKTNDNGPLNPDGSNAIPLLLEDDDPFFVPTLGFIVEF
ncbi:MAG TPA: TonB-dependent receptor, partial [Chryseosolibacter sp.]|nr:TonB-dependent receptor [Chryseosolibacter sp.]